CFQKDILNLVYLCKHYGLDEVAEYWHQVIKLNDYQKERFALKIIDFFRGNLEGKNIGILGWAFKPKTNDSRESPSIHIAKRILENKGSITVYDEYIEQDQIFEDLKNFKQKSIKVFRNFKENQEIDLLLIAVETPDLKIVLKEAKFKKIKLICTRF
ncbi:MAG: nucleotide sugar dehydrogenase, partial [Flavobacteriaceae bacterium]|nr:nucleotide sugar dehydrogenase [Flavobacteriaceae bacterium]